MLYFLKQNRYKKHIFEKRFCHTQKMAYLCNEIEEKKVPAGKQLGFFIV